MLFIEYVMMQGQTGPSAIYRVGTSARTLGTAEQVAQGTLNLVRRMFPTTPPDGFQIFDEDDQLVFRSWEQINVPVSRFRLRLRGAAFSSAAA